VSAFDVWAPAAQRVRLSLTGGAEPAQVELTDVGQGRWHVDAPDAEPGADYAFLLDDDDTSLPDPRSRWLPSGVHGPSRVYDDTAYEWSDGSWTGRQLAGSVIYELHIGTFTPGGTFDTAIERLDHLVELGIDLVEVLPIGSWGGSYNWGYDGVAWYAAHEAYGGPDGFKRFVDACHGRGLAVVLDVVYNHLGPSGNYLDRFGPYFSDATNPANPWGRTINLDGPGSYEVRRHIVDNALMWLADFHVDALRLDAVHALVDTSAVGILEQLAEEVDALSSHLRRPLSLIAESDLNDPRLVRSRQAGGSGLTAQWSDDFHHALHALLTGERQGYYADFGGIAAFARVLRRVFVHDGTWSSFRGRTHGRAVDTMRTPGWKFLAYLQNHDQVGNRAAGDRISDTLSPGLLKVGAALVMTSPFTPMIFMGEEWAASTPWQFFTSHIEPELAANIAAGRRAEFAAHGWPETEVADPQDPATFQRSKLDWDELEKDTHAELLDFHRRLIALRHARPELTDPLVEHVEVRYDEDRRWLVVHRGIVAVVVNLAPERTAIPIEAWPREMLLASERGFVYGEGQVEIDAESVVVIRTG